LLAPGVTARVLRARADDGRRGHRRRFPTTATDVSPTPARRLNPAHSHDRRLQARPSPHPICLVNGPTTPGRSTQ
jgi:hypothetical protein